jgi:flagellar basal body L-ring protein FlgH
MNKKLENRIIVALVVLLILIGLAGCGRNIQNCSFNPGVTVESKPESKEGETPKSESKIEERLPVKVSPKGEFTCSF